MANGKHHGIATISLAPPTGVSIGILSKSVDLAAMAMLGCLTGLIIDPDLDINGLTKSKTRLSKIALPLTYAWALLWSPYSWAIPHRSFISHSPLIGTAGRVLYLAIIIKLLAVIFGASLMLSELIANPLFIAWFVGLAVADTAHYLMDIASTGIKRKLRKW